MSLCKAIGRASICAVAAALGFSGTAGAADHSVAQTPALVWKLENPFRLFRDAADFEKLKMRPEDTVLSWLERHAPYIREDYLPFQRTYWSPAGRENVSGQYEPGYLLPKSHRVVLEWRSSPSGTCQWQVGNLPVINGACGKLAVDVPYSGAPSPTAVSVKSSSGESASTSVTVRDELILGLGDSYSAGEGVPDSPAQLTAQDSGVAKLDAFHDRVKNPAKYVWVPAVKSGKAAGWWDHECHRSLLSWQSLAALKLASKHAAEAASHHPTEQTSITFASYACSGAGFYDGLLGSQKNPPGPARAVDTNGKDVRRGQMLAATIDLCDNQGTAAIRLFRVTGEKEVPYRVQACESARVPNAVLVSIGGNDAWFAKVIYHTLLPRKADGNTVPGAMAMNALHSVGGTKSPNDAGGRLNYVGKLYEPLGRAFTEAFGVKPGQVHFMQYPNPVMRPDHLASGGKHCGLEMRAGMEAARFLGPFPDYWHMWGTQAEFREVEQLLITPMQGKIAAAVEKAGWKLVEGHLKDFLQHSLCADAMKPEDDLADKQPLDSKAVNLSVYKLPRQDVDSNNKLIPLASYEWKGAFHVAQKRWFRTPNDSVQTQTQPKFARSMNGAFHPNALGFARMADAAFDQLEGLGRR